MTAEQFDRWLDFSTRLAKTLFAGQRTRAGLPGVKWIVAAVREFILEIPKCDRVCLRDWDGSDPYPPGHEFHRIIRKSGCYHCSPRKDFLFSHLPGSGCEKCEGGWYVERAKPWGVGDTFRDWSHESLWCHWRGHATPEEIRAYDTGVTAEGRHRELTDDERDALREAVCDRWESPVHTCVRAGLDVASAPSAGVAGITVGTIRKMYKPGPVPAWVKSFFDNHEEHEITSVSTIGVTFKKVKGEKPARKFKTRFDSFHNSHEVWL